MKKKIEHNWSKREEENWGEEVLQTGWLLRDNILGVINGKIKTAIGRPG